MQHSSVPRRPVAVAVSGNTTVVVCDDGAVFVPKAGIGPHTPLEWTEVTPIPGSAREATLVPSPTEPGR